MPLHRLEANDVALDVEDQIDPSSSFDGDRRLGYVGQQKELPPTVRPARCLGDHARHATGHVELVEPGIGVRLPDARVARQMPKRMLAASVA